MADQGAIGRTREQNGADATYFPSKKHYARSFYTPVTGSAMGRMREHVTASKQFNIHKLYSRPFEMFWQARLGQVGRAVSSLPFPPAAVLRWMPHMGGSALNGWNENGSIYGVVTESAAPVANVRVLLLYREPTLTILRATFTDSNGRYRFDKLDATKSGYLVVAFDPAGGVQYNVGRLDRMTPTLVLSGEAMAVRGGLLAASHT
jgi:hypothetical protein